MSENGPVEEICVPCGEKVLELNHGRERLCGCSGMSAPAPSAAYERAAARAAEIQEEGKVQVVIMGEEE